tara:strand:- start:238 stop:1017 length:780 start_codon:yes stop_codon:yes gene_type:complete
MADTDWGQLRKDYYSDLESGVELDYFPSELEDVLAKLSKEVDLDADVDLLEHVAYDVYLGTSGQIDFAKMVEPMELSSLYEKVENEAYSHVNLGDAYNYLVGNKKQSTESVVNKLIESDFKPVINYFYALHENIINKTNHLKQNDPDNYSGQLFKYTDFVADIILNKMVKGVHSEKGKLNESNILLNTFYKKYGSIIFDKEELQKVLMYGMPYVYSEEGKNNILKLIESYKQGIGVTDTYYDSVGDAEGNMFQSLREEK